MIGRLLAVLGVMVAAAPSPPRMQPTGKWIVNFADAQCVASRNYGSEADPIYLILKAPPIGDVLQIGIVRNGPATEPAQADGQISFDDGPEIRTTLMEFGATGSGQVALSTTLPRSKLVPMQTASSIRIRAHPDAAYSPRIRIPAGLTSTDQTFAVSQIPALLTVIDSCVADLRKVWNIGPDGDHAPTIKSMPSNNVAALFTSEDYPDTAMARRQTGTAVMVLLIDESGKVADCTLTETSGAAALDAQGCAVIRERGKFTPAIGTDGRPAKSAIQVRVHWKL